MRKSRKVEVVAEFTAALQEAEHVILTDYRGLNVKEMTELRGAVREAGGRLRVMRNSLFLRALAGSDQSELGELLIGPVAATFVSGDPATLLRAMAAFARRHEQLAFKGGWVDSRAYGAADMATLADLPPRTPGDTPRLSVGPGQPARRGSAGDPARPRADAGSACGAEGRAGRRSGKRVSAFARRFLRSSTDGGEIWRL